MSENSTFIDPDVLEKLEAPMPWIGMYAAAASLICALAMAADALHGFWRKKYWFPSKYFSLNAASLTLIAVAMKLPMDLTTTMHSVTDRLAKVSSLVFLSTAMANFLPSLGSMDNKNVLMNVAALGILVITVVGNVSIQVVQMHSYLDGRLAIFEEMLAVGSMLILLVMFISTAVMIRSTKRCLETKYHEMHKSALTEEQLVDTRRVDADKLRMLIKKYWLMAETSSPQFVIARSVTCTAAGVLSLLAALVLVEVEIRMAIEYGIFDPLHSVYKWSTKWILLWQSVGVIVGSIAPTIRWFVAVLFRSLDKCFSGIKHSFGVEDYWIQRIVEWQQSSLSLKIQHLKIRKLLHNLKGLFLKLCIYLQHLNVLASKLVLFVSVVFICPIISCMRLIHWRTSNDSVDNLGLDIRHYVMLLEGEVQLPMETLRSIFNEVDEVIEKGRMLNSKHLLELLYKSSSFIGVAEFDSLQVPTPYSQQLPYCWSLPIVTLTCIAIALPNVDKKKSDHLLNSVARGHRFVMLVDKTLDTKDGLANIRTAADVTWVDVELYHKWQDIDLHEVAAKGKNSKEILEQLQQIAEKIGFEFKRDSTNCLVRNPLNWPPKAVAANAMHRVSTTMLMSHAADKTDDGLFEELSIMIADILVACFTNLAHVITMKCHRSAIEERESSVREAAILLGETEDIIALLQRRELPMLDPEQAAYIDEWRSLMKLEDQNNHDFISNADITIKVEE